LPLVIAALAAVGTLESRDTLSIGTVSCSTTRVERYGVLELAVELAAAYDNPLDPDDIDLRGTFTSPGGQVVEALGFFYQPYEVQGEYSDDRAPLLDEAGPPQWLIRFAPTEVGEWSFTAKARDRSGEVTSREGHFTVVDSDRRGFIRVSDRNPRYFAFDDGSPFIPIGQNLQNDWPSYSHSRRLADAGCNAARPWTFCHWTWLEWSHREDIQWAGPGHYMRSYGGAGIYNQRIAWIADLHLTQWERDGLHVMMCLGNGSELGAPDKYDSWGGHPYNAANGGFLDSGSEFWTDAQARRLYRNRLRYIVARYGHSSAVWAWELWNELGRETDEIVAWTREMSDYLHSIDPARHLVTTSHWGTNAEASPRTWELPGIDLTQSHNYFGVETVRSRTTRMLSLSAKPHIIGEGAGTHPGPDGASDPEGIDLHNSLWAALFSGAAGPTLPWWWRERIEPNDLFGEYSSIARFTSAINWLEEPWAPVGDEIAVAVAGRSAGPSPVLVVPLGPGWGPKPGRGEFIIAPDGTIDRLDELGPVLYGTGRTNWANPPTFVVDYPSDGQFIVRVSEAAHGIIEIDRDGENAARDDAFDVDRKSFTRDVSIDVPSGRHRITLRNTGSDWLRIGHILLTSYRDPSLHPDVEALALRANGSAALWIRHRLNEWPYRALGFEPSEQTGITVSLPGLQDGEYVVEWWNTRAGEVTRTERLSVAAGVATLALDRLTTDVACVLRAAP